ncbi:MAG TPA: hypothetical protein VGC41_27025, partial [Kofleriaceae bacterium]
LEALPLIASGTQPTPQASAHATHAAMLDKNDGAIDFTLEPRLVAARIRGVDPWPGAQAVLRGQPVKLFHARVSEHVSGGAAGTVVAIDKAGVHVACLGGIVAISELQAAGRKRLGAHDFAAGRGIAVGDVLTKPNIGPAAPKAPKPSPQ